MDSQYPVARRGDRISSYLAGDRPKRQITARMWVHHLLAQHPGIDDTRIAALFEAEYETARKVGHDFARVADSRLRTARDRLRKEGSVEFAGWGESVSGNRAQTWRLRKDSTRGGRADHLGRASDAHESIEVPAHRRRTHGEPEAVGTRARRQPPVRFRTPQG